MNSFKCLLVVLALVSGLNAPTAAFTGFKTETGASVDIQEKQNNKTVELLQAALAAFQQGKLDEALANCAKASGLSPNDYRPHALTAFVYMAQMKYRSASEAFGRAIQLQPQNKELYLLKATADSKRNATEEALAACRKALDLDPKYAEAYAVIGETLRWDKKRRPEAITAYRSAIKSNPRFLASYEPLGQLLDEAKEENNAEEVLRQGLATDPTHMNSRFVLGRILVKQGRLVEARELWDGRTSDEDHTFPQFIALLKRAENLKQATDVLAKKPNDPDALIDMGLAVMDGDSWVVDGRQERAIIYFKEALKLRPDYARAQYGICKAYVHIASTFRNEKEILDRELVKLRQLDSALADELEEYKKNYVGGIVGGTPVNFDR